MTKLTTAEQAYAVDDLIEAAERWDRSAARFASLGEAGTVERKLARAVAMSHQRRADASRAAARAISERAADAAQAIREEEPVA
jgi:hypothetical protein